MYAIDAKTGEIRWIYDPKVPRTRAFFICCDVVNRGAALYKGKVYVGTLDGRLIALDERTGAPVWDVSTVDSTKAYAITGAPRVAKGMVVIGNAATHVPGIQPGAAGCFLANCRHIGTEGVRSCSVDRLGRSLWRDCSVLGT